MISYQTEGVKMPDIKKKKTTGWIKEVAACYGTVSYTHLLSASAFTSLAVKAL